MDDISVEVCGENVAWYKVCNAKDERREKKTYLVCVLVNPKEKKLQFEMMPTDLPIVLMLFLSFD